MANKMLLSLLLQCVWVVTTASISSGGQWNLIFQFFCTRANSLHLSDITEEKQAQENKLNQ